MMVRAALITCCLVAGNPEEPSCGARALYSAFQVRGLDCTVEEVAAALTALPNAESGGDSLTDLAKAARRFKFLPVMACFAARRVDSLPRGSIVHLASERSGHFVVFLGESSDGVVLGDAPIPPYQLSHESFRDLWTGNALLLFAAHEEAAAFEDCVRWQHRWFLAAAAVGVGALAGLAYLLPWRRAIARLGWFHVGIIVACFVGGCSPGELGHVGASFPCDFSPKSPIDAGFVPPSGKEFEITLRNTTDREVVLKTDVKPSCGCTSVRVPERIAAHGNATLLIELEGQREPIARTTSFVLETIEKQRTPIRLAFVTGHLPCATPYVVELSKDGAHHRSGVVVVWFNSTSLERVELRCDSRSRLAGTVLDGDGYRREGPNSLALSRTGLIGIRVQLDERERNDAFPAAGRGTIALVLGARTEQVPYTYSTSDESGLVLQPREVMFLHGDRDISQSRVVIIRAAGPGRCRVLRAPPFVSANLRELSENTWKLVLATATDTPVMSGDHELAIIWEAPSSEDKVKASLTIKVRGDGVAAGEKP